MRHMREVARLIREIAAMRRTVIVVTHDPEFALAAADDVVTIDNGRAVDAYPLRRTSGVPGAAGPVDPKAARRLIDTLTAKTAPSNL